MILFPSATKGILSGEKGANIAFHKQKNFMYELLNFSDSQLTHEWTESLWEF